MEWIIGAVISLVVGLGSGFLATWYSNKKATEREVRAGDERASEAIRAYIRALDEYSDYLEAQQMSGELDGVRYDATKELINIGSQDAVRAAYAGAAPYFHRLRPEKGERRLLGNSYPDHGDHPMAGANNYAERANAVQAVLDRGFAKD